MRPALLLLPLAIAACQPVTSGTQGVGANVPPGEVRVAAVDATPSRVVIRLSNGKRCVSERPEGVPGNWSGVTSGEDCGYKLPFAVSFKQGATPQRFTIEAAPAGVGPRAEVFVTDVDGVRRLFASPLGPNVRFEQQA
ncbi:hypothetical protein SAMN05444004_10466 [Jannaschia faecimaris]|uniref:Uncharacterized protein n=1 Tax=Jannaschia faecimaris TaxID=1244108 RepID=A0A1H3NQ10_9RHOB|nr:hypothetical protein [Jannaschia faecimaris]SDY91006.1 hypothetical protein SAMN05444004_10466 [Jannaschia faecimaris]